MNFFMRALLEVTILGILAGGVGALIVMRRRAFFTVALSHATFPGGVLFALAGWNVLAGQALFAGVLVGLMVLIDRVPRQGRQVASGIVLSFGFALGTLLASLNPNLAGTTAALLVGSPLGISDADLWATVSVTVLVLGLLALFGRQLIFDSFDRAGFTAAGFRPAFTEALSTAIIALAVVVAMPAVGAILGAALMVAPAAAARLLVRRVDLLAPVAVVFGIAGGVGGLFLSRWLDIAAGGAIGLSSTALYFAALIFVWLRRLVVEGVKGVRGGRHKTQAQHVAA